jgi:membrane fusion protein (multidrug efflux system)
MSLGNVGAILKYTLLVGLLCLVNACEKKGDANSELADLSTDERVPVKVQTITRGSYKEYGEYFGTIRAFQEVNLEAYAGGRVKSISVKNGDAIKAGTKLCDIDGERLNISYESAKLAEQIAKATYERNRLHLKNGGTSKLRADQSRLEHLQAKGNLVTAEKNRNGAYCISPFDGIVVAKNIEQFQDINPGQPTLRIAALDKVKLFVGIPESSVGGYQPGNEVQILLSNYPDRTWTGAIHSVAQSVNELDRSVQIEIHVENDDHSLLPGATARARILKWDLKDEIVIPSEVVITQSNRRVVMLAEGPKAVMRTVKIRTSNESHSIVDDGLAPGDLLITSGQTQVTDGAPIKVAK